MRKINPKYIAESIKQIFNKEVVVGASKKQRYKAGSQTTTFDGMRVFKKTSKASSETNDDVLLALKHRKIDIIKAPIINLKRHKHYFGSWFNHLLKGLVTKKEADIKASNNILLQYIKKYTRTVGIKGRRKAVGVHTAQLYRNLRVVQMDKSI